MKNYKNLVPLFLSVLVLLSAYMLFDGARQKEIEYNSYLKSARAASEKGIIVDATEYYGHVLELKDTVAVRSEIGEMFMENDMINEGIECAEETIERFPEEREAYETLIKMYKDCKDYQSCFEVAKKMEGGRIQSKKADQLLETIRYEYEEGTQSYDEVSVFSEGLCAVKKEDAWGYCDRNGRLVTATKFRKAGAFLTSVAPVVDQKGNRYYIDPQGNKKVVYPEKMKVKELGLVTDQILVLNNNGKFGYYDTAFKHQFGKYDFASTMGYEKAAVRNGGDWYLINQKGEKINTKPYKDIVLDEKNVSFRNDRAFVKTGKQYVMVDGKAKVVGKEAFEEAKLFMSQSYAAVKIGDTWGFVDQDGKIVINPEYEDARSFANGLAAVKKDGKWGYINEKNKMVITNQFDDCREFNEYGSAFVKMEDEWSTIRLFSKM